MSLIRRNAINNAWVGPSFHTLHPACTVRMHSTVYVPLTSLLPVFLSAALDSLKQELLVMQEDAEEQERRLKVLRDDKLAQVAGAA